MAIKYYLATNTGKGFITHADSAAGHIAEHPGGIYTTEHDHSVWASRVGAAEKTKEEAQALCDATYVDDSGNRLYALENISSTDFCQSLKPTPFGSFLLVLFLRSFN